MAVIYAIMDELELAPQCRQELKYSVRTMRIDVVLSTALSTDQSANVSDRLRRRIGSVPPTPTRNSYYFLYIF